MIILIHKYIIIIYNIYLKNLKSFCGKKDAFDCAGIRGSNPSAVESVFISTEGFSNSLNI